MCDFVPENITSWRPGCPQVENVADLCLNDRFNNVPVLRLIAQLLGSGQVPMAFDVCEDGKR